MSVLDPPFLWTSRNGPFSAATGPKGPDVRGGLARTPALLAPARLRRGLIRAPYALPHELFHDLPQVREQRPVSLAPAAKRRPATPAVVFRHALPRLQPPSLSYQRHRSGGGCCCPAFGHSNRRGRSRLDAPRAAARTPHCASAGSKRQLLTVAPLRRGLFCWTLAEIDPAQLICDESGYGVFVDRGRRGHQASAAES